MLSPKIPRTTAALAAALLAACPGVRAASLTTLHSFAETGGASPEAGPIEHGGKLFGTTASGTVLGAGPLAQGVIYELDPSTGTESVLYAFQGGTDGAQPQAGVVYNGGALYGTTFDGGNPQFCVAYGGCGTVYRYDLKRGSEVVLHSFTDEPDGSVPSPGNLIVEGGKLYGATVRGGAYGMGTVYAIDAQSGAETIIHSFSGNRDGAYPESGLTFANGTLYGQTAGGGDKDCYKAGCGTVFAIAVATGTETVLHRFTGFYDGEHPFGNLAYHDGKLFGATQGGGAPYGDGVIFEIDAATGAEHILYGFKGYPDGAGGDGVIYHGGRLYGSTDIGGANATLGTVYSFDLATNTETVLYSFTGAADGANPYGTLLYRNGSLLGTTSSGNTYPNAGTVFELSP